MLVKCEFPAIAAAYICRTDQCRIGMAVRSQDIDPVAEYSKIVGGTKQVSVRNSQVAPAVRRCCGRGDFVAGMDTVHFARLREGQQTILIEMLDKVVSPGEPEALLDLEQFVFERHRNYSPLTTE